jgi:hypothetical protein
MKLTTLKISYFTEASNITHYSGLASDKFFFFFLKKKFQIIKKILFFSKKQISPSSILFYSY